MVSCCFFLRLVHFYFLGGHSHSRTKERREYDKNYCLSQDHLHIFSVIDNLRTPK